MTRKAILAALVMAALAASAMAQPWFIRVPPRYPAGFLPTCDASRNGDVYAATAAVDCETGGGTLTLLCQCQQDGAAYDLVAVGSGDPDTGPVPDCADGESQLGDASCYDPVTQAELDALGSVYAAITHASAHGGGGSDEITITEAQISDLTHTTNTDDQTATEVPYTPSTGADWIDPDPTDVGGALDTLAASAGGGAASSGYGLQAGDGSGGFVEVTGSGVEAEDVTLSGVMSADGGWLGGGLTSFTSGSFNFEHRVPSNGVARFTAVSNAYLRVDGAAANRSAYIQLSRGQVVAGQVGVDGYSDVVRIKSGSGGTLIASFSSAGLGLADPGIRPTCDITTWGNVFFDQGGAGVADSVAMCLKSDADTYSWVALATP
jgi:hypothetical protein